jgi:DNA adenine methylase
MPFENAKILKYNPHPFLKWAGGKRQLLSQMKKSFPIHFNNYIEPFVGGGAVFFHLLPKKAILIDINEVLIDCYKMVKNDVYTLIDSLRNHKNERDYYYKIRNKDRNPKFFYEMTKLEKVSRFIYLNRCCYNGLYRVNSKGQFNVPFGRYINPNFCDETNLLAVNKALQNVELIHGSFEICLNFAKENDFIYFDPPYHPISETSSFTSYTKENFGKESQIKLFNVFKRLDERGCKLILSNSYDPFITELYSDYQIIFLNAKRAINSDATKRGIIKEVLVLN